MLLRRLSDLLQTNLSRLPYSYDRVNQWLNEIKLPWEGDIVSKDIKMLQTFTVIKWNELLREIRAQDNNEPLANEVKQVLEGLLNDIAIYYLGGVDNDHIYPGILVAGDQSIKDWLSAGFDFDIKISSLHDILILIRQQSDFYGNVSENPLHEVHHPLLYEFLRNFARLQPRDRESYWEKHQIDGLREAIKYQAIE